MKTVGIEVRPLEGRVDRLFDNGQLRRGVGTYNSLGYLLIGIDGDSVRVHRLIYSHFHGPIAPWHQIDHIDGDRSRNGVANLRRTDQTGNSQNQRRAHRDSASGLLGAVLDKRRGCWRSTIMREGRSHFLGNFPTALEAHEAFIAAKRELHATCTI